MVGLVGEKYGYVLGNFIIIKFSIRYGGIEKSSRLVIWFSFFFCNLGVFIFRRERDL